MKIFNVFIVIIFSYCGLNAQIDATLLLGLNTATTTEINAIANPIEGTLIYNTTDNAIQVYTGAAWEETVELPADLLDGDDDTTYTAGAGLALSGTSFSVNNSTIAPDWSNITNIPTNLDTSNTNEIQTLSLSGNNLSISGTGGNTVTLPSISETTTTLSQNTTTGVVSYTNEATVTQTANIISTDANNALSAGSDGGAFFESNVTTSTIQVDQSFIWAGSVNDPDIHVNGTLTVNQSRADTGWALTGASTLTYTGTPDHVKIDLMAVANNTGNHWAHPHIKVFRDGVEIGEGSGLHMDNSNTYSGRTTTVIAMVDPAPGTNPVYTFTTLEDDSRTMNNPTIVSLSPVSIVAVEKVAVVVSITN